MSDNIYQLPKLQKIPNLIHGVSKKSAGNMSFIYGDKEEVIANRQKLFHQLNLDLEDAVFMKVMYKDEYSVVSSPDKGKGTIDIESAIKVDALITKEKGVVLSLLIADCLPIIFFDSKQEILALAHLGWQGTNLKLSETILKLFISEYQSQPKDIFVGIGPGIHQESYLVSDPSQAKDPDWKPYLKKMPNDQIAIDVVGYNLKQIESCHIPKQNIDVSPIDTAVSPDFFSFYRASHNKCPDSRHLTIAAIK